MVASTRAKAYDALALRDWGAVAFYRDVVGLIDGSTIEGAAAAGSTRWGWFFDPF